MTFILFLFFAVVGIWVLLNFTPLQHRQEFFLWLFHFELLQKLDKVCTYWKTYQASWSISIDLDAQYVSSFTEVFLLKNSFQTLIYAFQKNSTSFLINNMSLTYNYQKGCSAPTHFIVNTGFTASPYKTICFDQLIKPYIPTLRCLHQSIDGSLELAHFVSTFRIDKTLWLYHIQLFFNKSTKECSSDNHFSDFIKCGNC